MCTEVFPGWDKPEIGTPRQLAAYIGIDPDDLPATRDRGRMGDVMKDYPADQPDWRDSCLCPVDVVLALQHREFWIRYDCSGYYDVRRWDEVFELEKRERAASQQ